MNPTKTQHIIDILLVLTNLINTEGLNWKPEIEKMVRSGKLPKNLTKHDFQPIPFDPEQAKRILSSLKRLIDKTDCDPIRPILIKACDDLDLLVDLNLARGTPAVYDITKWLYGDYKHVVPGYSVDLDTAARNLLEPLKRHSKVETDTVPASIARDSLERRINNFFKDAVKVRLGPATMASDAEEGGATINIRDGAKFSQADIKIFASHEGMAHAGTELNAMMQPDGMGWLNLVTPSVLPTTEGLAVLMEIVTNSIDETRAKKILGRTETIKLIKDGANFFDVVKHQQELGLDEDKAFVFAKRMFKGCPLTGGTPNCKDIIYLKGLLEVTQFIVEQGTQDKIPLLFVGRFNIYDIDLVEQLVDKGMVAKPKYVPTWFLEPTQLILQLRKFDLKGLTEKTTVS